MTSVLEHLAQDSDSDESDESGSEMSDNYQSDNDYNCRLVNLTLCISQCNEKEISGFDVIAHPSLHLLYI